MRSIFSLVLTACMGVLPSLSAQQEKQTLYLLEEGENLIPEHSCFTLTGDHAEFTLATEKEGKFFLVDNGNRSGPFPELTGEMLPTCRPRSGPPCARHEMIECFGDSVFSKYIFWESWGQVIRFLGKTYGPYTSVVQFALSCDGHAMAAIVMDNETNLSLLKPDGSLSPVSGTPNWLILSPDGSQLLYAMGKKIEPETVDVKNLDISEYIKFRVYDIQGNVFGPYDGDKVPAEYFWFCKSGGGHWYHQEGNQILRDGKPYRSFDASYNSCDLWFSRDGKRTAVADHGQNRLPYGTDIIPVRSPLQVQYDEGEGRSLLRWITLEEGKKLVLFTQVL